MNNIRQAGAIMNQVTITAINTYIDVYFAICNPNNWGPFLRSVCN